MERDRRLYVHFAFSHPERYESFDAYKPGDEHLRAVRAILPPVWRIDRKDVWFHVAPPDVKLVPQGWKIHVSATPKNSVDMLETAARICVENDVAFKFALDRQITRLITSKGWGRESAGKVVTVYPNSEAEFTRVLVALSTALEGFEGPHILSDRRYGGSSVVHYRYGGIAGPSILTPSGTRQSMLIAPDGTLVPDQRLPFWAPPLWVKLPFASEGSENPDGAAALTLKGHRYRVDSALGTSVTGGVYKGVDLETNDPVAIKEARPYTGVDENGLDATDRLRKEFRLLQELEETGVTPKPLDIFCDWEHVFLAEEFVAGLGMIKYVMTKNPFLQGTYSAVEMETYLESLRSIWISLAEGVQAIHARNIVIGDLSMNNVIITDQQQGSVRLIDLEAAWQAGVDEPYHDLRTPGYSPKGGIKVANDEVYSLGAIFAASLCPSTLGLSILEPDSIGNFLTFIAHNTGLPPRVLRMILDCLVDTGDRPSLRHIIDELRRPHAAAHTNLDIVSKPNVAEIEATVGKAAEYIMGSAQYYRTDSLFPADPMVFLTNPLSMAYGAIGVARALQCITGETPRPLKSWILSRQIHPDRYPPGLYVGTAGIAWGLVDIGLPDVASKLLRSDADHPLLFRSADIFQGASGRGMAYLKLYLNSGEQYWLDQAVAIGEWLLESRTEGEDGWCWPGENGSIALGYAHGASGVALFLLYLSLAAKDHRFLSAGQAALDHDLGYCLDIPGQPLSMPRGPVGTRGMTVRSHYWIEGSSGVGTALARYARVTADNKYLDVLERLSVDAMRKYTAFPGLFRGLSGLGNFLLDAYDHIGDSRYLDAANQTANSILLFRIAREGRVTFPGEQLLRISTDYGTGSAGIALFLYRLVHSAEHPGDFNCTLDTLLG